MAAVARLNGTIWWELLVAVAAAYHDVKDVKRND